MACRIRRSLLFWVAAFVLAACTGSFTAAPSPPGPTEFATPNPTAPATPPSGVGEARPTAITPPATTTSATPVATEQPLDLDRAPLLQGEALLRLGRGGGEGEIDYADLLPTLRIGSDGTVRILDPGNRRLHIFGMDGSLQRSIALPDVAHPRDFAIDGTGALFVLDSPPPQAQRRDESAIVHYGPDGTLRERLPVTGEPDWVVLNSDADLVVGTVGLFWVVRYNGVPVPAEHQLLTQRIGVVTPRSPSVFELRQDEGHDRLMFRPLEEPIATTWHDLNWLAGRTVTFLTVDQGMNLYFVGRAQLEETALTQLAVLRASYRVDDGLQAWGRIEIESCQVNGRSRDRWLYVDREGRVWYLCAGETEVVVKRYTLHDLTGIPVPVVQAGEVPNVPYAPGARRPDAPG